MEKYLDANKKPLEAGSHYLRNSDIQGTRPLFYDGKNLIDLDGNVISPEGLGGLFKIADEKAHISNLEQISSDTSRAAAFMRVNRHEDVTSVYVGDAEPVGEE